LVVLQTRAIDAMADTSLTAHDLSDFLHPGFWLVDFRRGSADSVSYYAIVNGTHEFPLELNVISAPELLSSDPPMLRSRLSGGDALVAVWRQVDGQWKSMTMVLTK